MMTMNESRRDGPIVCWLGLGVIVLFVSAAFTPLPNLLAECVALAPEPGPADAIVVLAGGGASELYRPVGGIVLRSEEHTSELQSPWNLVSPLLPAKKKNTPDEPPP